MNKKSIIQNLPLLCMPSVLLVNEGKCILYPVLCHVCMKSSGDGTEHATADFQIE